MRLSSANSAHQKRDATIRANTARTVHKDLKMVNIVLARARHVLIFN
jgi:hypothetical protein